MLQGGEQEDCLQLVVGCLRPLVGGQLVEGCSGPVGVGELQLVEEELQQAEEEPQLVEEELQQAEEEPQLVVVALEELCYQKLRQEVDCSQRLGQEVAVVEQEVAVVEQGLQAVDQVVVEQGLQVVVQVVVAGLALRVAHFRA
jgi:hypothetical protein